MWVFCPRKSWNIEASTVKDAWQTIFAICPYFPKIIPCSFFLIRHSSTAGWILWHLSLCIILFPYLDSVHDFVSISRSSTSSPPCDFPCFFRRLGGVLISKVVSDGLVDRWNQQQKAAGAAGSSRIKVGDRIIALNGDELKGDDLLERLKTFGRPGPRGFLGLGMWRLGECIYVHIE